jgi:hypothetical protein
MGSESESPWERLGRLLGDRRIEIAARYKNKNLFAAEREINRRMVWSVESGARGNYEKDTLRDIERAYMLIPGSIRRTLDGGGLEPDPPVGPAPLRPVPAVPAAAGGTVEEVAQEILDGILSRYPDDDAVQAIGVRPGWRAPQRVVEILRILGDRELSQEVLDGLTARYPDDGVVEAIGARQSRRNPAVRVLDVFAWLRWLESDPELSQGENGMTGLTCCVLSEI